MCTLSPPRRQSIPRPPTAILFHSNRRQTSCSLFVVARYMLQAATHVDNTRLGLVAMLLLSPLLVPTTATSKRVVGRLKLLWANEKDCPPSCLSHARQTLIRHHRCLLTPPPCDSIHPSGRMALSVSRDRTLRLWNLLEGRCAYIKRLQGEGELVRWSSEGDR